jgi:peptidylprolyl isomerase
VPVRLYPSPIEGHNVKLRTSAGLVAFALGSALALTGCGDGDSSGDAGASASPSVDPSGAGAETIVAGGVCEPGAAEAPPAPEATEADKKAIEGVEVAGALGEKPEDISFETPLSVEGVAVNVLAEGDGAALVEGGQVTFHDLAVNGEDGEPLPGMDGEPRLSTWDEDEGQEAQQFRLGDPTYQILNEPLTGLNVGARLVIAWQGMDGTTEVHVVDVVDAEPPAAAGGGGGAPRGGGRRAAAGHGQVVAGEPGRVLLGRFHQIGCLLVAVCPVPVRPCAPHDPRHARLHCGELD